MSKSKASLRTLRSTNPSGWVNIYEGGTLMQCSLVPRVRYLEVGRMLHKQETTLAKIRALSKSYIVH
jgi:histone acetyltransferase